MQSEYLLHRTLTPFFLAKVVNVVQSKCRITLDLHENTMTQLNALDVETGDKREDLRSFRRAIQEARQLFCGK